MDRHGATDRAERFNVASRMAQPSPQPEQTEPRREWSLPADPRSVAIIRSGIRSFARQHGAPDDTLAAIALAVSEAVTNAVVHAFVDMEPGVVSAAVEAGRDELVIRVADDGRGMQPRPDSPGLGMGLPLIGQLAGSMDIRERNGRGTEICMTFEAPGVQGPPRATSDPGRLALLERISRVAVGSSWPGEGLDRLVEVLVPEVGDGCSVDLLDEDGRPHRVAARAIGPDGEDLTQWARQRVLPVDQPGSASARALHGAGTQVEEIAATSTGGAIQDWNAETAARIGVRWRISAPIGAPGRILGVLLLGVREERGRPDADLVRFTEAVAERVGEALANTRLVEELRRARERFERILNVLGEAVTVNDAEGRVVYANEAAARLLGAESLDEVVNAPPGELAGRFIITTEDGRPVANEDLPSWRLLHGEPDPPALLTRSVHRSTGKAWWLLTKATLLEDASGPLAVNIIEDLTEARASEWRLRFLAEASERLASSLEYEHTMQEVARLAVPVLADWCGLDVVTPEGGLRRVGLAHIDPEREALGRELNERYPPDLEADQGVGAALHGAGTQVWNEIPDDLLVAGARDEGHLALLREIGMRSVMIVPMRLQERTVGVLSLVQAQSGRTFADGDVRVAEDLARRAAVALENARLYSELRGK